MKFTFTDPKPGTPQVDLVEGDVTKVVEDQKGNQVIKLGIGKGAEMTRRKLMSAIKKAVRLAREHKLVAVTFSMSDFQFPALSIEAGDLGRIFAENVLFANYEFTAYKTRVTYKGIDTVYVVGASKAHQDGIKVGEIVANEANFARDLANTPGSDMTPEALGEAAKKRLKGTGVTVKVLGLADIKKLKMGMLLAVGKGAEEEPRFIIAEYWGAAKSEKPIVLVGKGITYDTGGLSLKPTEHMLGMERDMTGGASVIATIAAVAKLKLKKNVVALLPAAENSISGCAYRPGDILTAIDGTTVEIWNTDAEGRLVLGDALAYAERYQPRLTIDVATLTGAIEVALGNRASGIFTKSEKFASQVHQLGEMSGDYVWPMPLYDEQNAEIKGVQADLMNTASNSRKGGALTGAAFLAHFARNLGSWMHIDMASRDVSIPSDNIAKGATGEPVRLLVRIIEEA